jgi:type I restriction enzyme S subunit
MRSNYKKLGGFIRPVDERNSDLAITNLQGVSITKEFVPSIANIIGTDLSTYKIVRTGQFAYGPVTSRNGDKVSIALLKGEDCIISSSYSPFEVYKPDELLPEYLMLWFMRPEFDRYARFMSNGSAREVFDWDCMCGVELPVPPLPEQQKIVHDYQAITDRIELLRKESNIIEEMIGTLFRQYILENKKYDDYVVFEFGQYPSVWSLDRMDAIVDVRDGTHDSPSSVSEGHKLVTSVHLNSYSVNTQDAYAISDKDYNEINKRSLVKTWDILMSMIGTVGRLSLVTDNPVDFAIKNMALFKTSNLSHEMCLYLLSYLKSDVTNKYLSSFLAGSTQSYVSLETLRSMPVIIPFDDDLQVFVNNVEPMYYSLITLEKEIHCLETLALRVCP